MIHDLSDDEVEEEMDDFTVEADDDEGNEYVREKQPLNVGQLARQAR